MHLLSDVSDEEKVVILEIILEVLKLDPYDVVKAEIDGFDPYVCFAYPKHIVDKKAVLDHYDLEDLYDEWECDNYHQALLDHGAVHGVDILTKEAKHELKKAKDLIDSQVNKILLKE